MSKAKGMTDEEAAAVITLVRGGWLRLELTDPPSPVPGTPGEREEGA